jgi:hypothetical protein
MLEIRDTFAIKLIHACVNSVAKHRNCGFRSPVDKFCQIFHLPVGKLSQDVVNHINIFSGTTDTQTESCKLSGSKGIYY